MVVKNDFSFKTTDPPDILFYLFVHAALPRFFTMSGILGPSSPSTLTLNAKAM
jgi:hypothetical protein